jgi:two-component system LytT family response regulator
METYSVIIVDDEADGRNIISLLLKQRYNNLIVIGEAESVVEGIALINTTKADLIFLDVEMPDGNAFDIISHCDVTSAQIILVTAYDHYAIKAIKASVLDYILKPVNKDDFFIAVDRALKSIDQKVPIDLSTLISNMQKHLIIRKIRIPTISGFTVVNVDDILRCEASSNYTIVKFINHSEVIACRTLGEYEEELKGYGFVRIHHKHLININHIVEYNKGKGGGYIVLYDRQILEVSARKKADLLNAIG